MIQTLFGGKKSLKTYIFIADPNIIDMNLLIYGPPYILDILDTFLYVHESECGSTLYVGLVATCGSTQ